MKNRVSLKITLILLLLLSTLPVGVLISLSILGKIQNDASAINNIGYIRGSTQRLLASHLKDDPQEIIKHINMKFKEIDTVFVVKNRDSLEASHFQDNYDQLKANWKELKDALAINAPNEELSNISKLCWNSADKTADAAAKVSEQKHEEIVMTVFSVGSLIFILLIISLYIIYTEVRNKLEVNVIRDPLTNLYNRTYLLTELNSRIKLFERMKDPFGILFIDIDNFKYINDTYGHRKGDNILIEFSSLTEDMLRDADMVFRYGGEEFIILVKFGNADEAYRLAERLRNKIKEFDFGLKEAVTISIGISEFFEDGSIDKLLTDADNAMYQAKSKGRDQTCIYKD